MLAITNDVGTTFHVRVVATGARYGLGNFLTNEGAPMIEIYDAKHGDFISRYYVHTFANSASAQRTGVKIADGFDMYLTGQMVRDAIKYARTPVLCLTRIDAMLLIERALTGNYLHDVATRFAPNCSAHWLTLDASELAEFLRGFVAGRCATVGGFNVGELARPAHNDDSTGII